MRSLQDIFEGLLNSDFDGVDIEAMPKVGQTIIDLWSGIKKKRKMQSSIGRIMMRRG